MADDGRTTFPGGGKIAGLALLLVAVVALIVKGPWSGPATLEAPDLALLQDLGTGAGAPLDDLERRLGGEGGPGGDDPVDLLDLPGGSPAVRPAATRAPLSDGGLDIPDDVSGPAIPVPTRAATEAPATTPAARADGLRPVDGAKLLAAYQAGDHGYIESVLRDPSLETAGRALAVALAAMLPEAPVNQTLYELFEGTSEPFVLRESSAYALLGRSDAGFPTYLLRVLGRPRVRTGEDRASSRLVLLSFAADRWMHGGEALDQVGDELIREAREGSPIAAAALSFGLTPSRPLVDERARLEALAPEQPAISGNLRRFYESMIERGRADYRPALERLQTKDL